MGSIKGIVVHSSMQIHSACYFTVGPYGNAAGHPQFGLYGERDRGTPYLKGNVGCSRGGNCAETYAKS